MTYSHSHSPNRPLFTRTHRLHVVQREESNITSAPMAPARCSSPQRNIPGHEMRKSGPRCLNRSSSLVHPGVASNRYLEPAYPRRLEPGSEWVERVRKGESHEHSPQPLAASWSSVHLLAPLYQGAYSPQPCFPLSKSLFKSISDFCTCLCACHRHPNVSLLNNQRRQSLHL